MIEGGARFVRIHHLRNNVLVGLHGSCPRPHIARAIRTPKAQAIAYLGPDAPHLLSLRAGDVLVANASSEPPLPYRCEQVLGEQLEVSGAVSLSAQLS